MQVKMNIEKKVEVAMNSLDGLQKAGPAPFFFTRLQVQLQKEQNSRWSSIGSFITRPAVAVGGIGFIVLLNVAALFYQKEYNTTAMLSDQNETAIADDYNTTMSSNSYYDENIEAR